VSEAAASNTDPLRRVALRRIQDPFAPLRHVDIRLESGLATGYSNLSQIARVVTESWVQQHLYCPICESEALSRTPPSTRVVDFICEKCDEAFQLKSQSRPFGARVTDAAYGPMIERIKSSSAPNLVFLHYSLDRWVVRNLFFVPRFFVHPSIIERRQALKSTARRAGWVGCNILLSSLPSDARIPAVSDEEPLPRAGVRESWHRFEFLGNRDLESRGWTADVLACVRDLRRESFSASDIYAFERRLGSLHPLNRSVRPKIRQQLQILRDHGIIEFLGKGRYRILLLQS